ncbi:hypothetical protein T12_1074 [Trichinella patagoniensis]|uniref:Uncharacterized protein n=1 Tax=Trichinella patagoniensis TaxID=990121 RepID=A0A0V0ZMK0_9BILA|nr:hypothetical protein T12_1074 [Trichinella patagoniensis]
MNSSYFTSFYDTYCFLIFSTAPHNCYFRSIVTLLYRLMSTCIVDSNTNHRFMFDTIIIKTDWRNQEKIVTYAFIQAWEHDQLFNQSTEKAEFQTFVK